MVKKQLKDKQIVEVSWLDAMGDQKADKSLLDNVEPSSLLIENKTYGILYKKDDFAIVIIQEDSSDIVDYTVVPKALITNIRILK